MIGTNPNRADAGLGRQLYERFFEDVRARGARRVVAVTWPGNRVSVEFHRAMGFEPADGPGTQRLYGTPVLRRLRRRRRGPGGLQPELVPRPPRA